MSIPRPTAKGWRDTLLFLTGLGLIINESVIRTGPERPTLILLFAGMCGLPAFLRTGDARQSEKPEPESKP